MYIDYNLLYRVKKSDYRVYSNLSTQRIDAMSEIKMNEYQALAAVTSGAGKDGERRQIVAALGLAGEAGEFANKIKKMVAHGHAITDDELSEELGDVLWYLAEAATACGLTLNEIAQMNVDKLRARYPEGFSEEASINREV
jgi:NTP pyrophosphatase (non-canonical NTP hydrolase)